MSLPVEASFIHVPVEQLQIDLLEAREEGKHLALEGHAPDDFVSCLRPCQECLLVLAHDRAGAGLGAVRFVFYLLLLTRGVNHYDSFLNDWGGVLARAFGFLASIGT